MTRAKLFVSITTVILIMVLVSIRSNTGSNNESILPRSQFKMEGYVQPFHDKWRREHSISPFECWSDDGYDSASSELPRDVQIFAAMDYGKKDIDNGGFHQFFYNSTGVFAPEMVEWCERAGLIDVAAVISDAMSRLDNRFPRSRLERQKALKRGMEFSDLDLKFYALLSNNGSRFDNAADNWLTTTCGITKLSDKPKAESGKTVIDDCPH